jgi:hypothetical protein
MQKRSARDPRYALRSQGGLIAAAETHASDRYYIGGEMADSAVTLYIDLLNRCVTNLVYQDPAVAYLGEQAADGALNPFSMERRIAGKDWPSQAHTMIGLRRLDNIQLLAERILHNGIPGDFIEAGIWRGGSTIFMRGLLKAYGVTDRTVWVADAFGQGLPTAAQGASDRSYLSPNLKRQDALLAGAALPTEEQAPLDLVKMGTSYDDVRERFGTYDLLDDQVRFLRGWVKDTLPEAPIERVALMRLDADFYDSTLDAIQRCIRSYPPAGTRSSTTTEPFSNVERRFTTTSTRSEQPRISRRSTTRRSTGRRMPEAPGHRSQTRQTGARQGTGRLTPSWPPSAAPRRPRRP